MKARLVTYTADDTNRENPTGIGGAHILVSSSDDDMQYVISDVSGYFTIPDAWSSYSLYIPDYGGYPADTFTDENGVLMVVVKVMSSDKSSSEPEENLEDMDETEKRKAPVMREPYFAGSNAQLYLIGKDFLDPIPIEAGIFQWQVSYIHNPLYSHNVMKWDTLMAGNYLVQGGLGITLERALDLYSLTHDKNGHPYPVNLQLHFILDFNDKELHSATYLFEDVYFTSMSHIVTPSGEPVGEMYEFIARLVTETTMVEGEWNYQTLQS